MNEWMNLYVNTGKEIVKDKEPKSGWLLVLGASFIPTVMKDLGISSQVD